MQNKKYGSFTSVDSPEKFSLMWESVIKVLSFLLSVYLSFKGVEAAAAAQIVTSNVTAFTMIGTAVVACWEAKNAVFGAVRRLIASRNLAV